MERSPRYATYESHLCQGEASREDLQSTVLVSFSSRREEEEMHVHANEDRPKNKNNDKAIDLVSLRSTSDATNQMTFFETKIEKKKRHDAARTCEKYCASKRIDLLIHCLE